MADLDPFRPRTEAQRVIDAEIGETDTLHPLAQTLVGVHSGPPPEPLASSATIPAHEARRVIGPAEAANRIRDEFVPEVVDPVNVRHEKFLKAVARNLGADPSPNNLKQIVDLLGKSEVELPNHDYPKMVYGRTIPDAEYGLETHVNLRQDYVGVVVKNEDDVKKLGSGWVEKPEDLEKRKPEDRGQYEDGPKAEPAKPPIVTAPTTPPAPKPEPIPT